jgi:predicted O-methyltransferase YrrM
MLNSTRRRISKGIGGGLAHMLPKTARSELVRCLAERDLATVVEAVGPHLNRKPDIDSMCFDLPVDGEIQFDNLAGLFASTSLDHGVISMTIRQAAYVFGLVRRLKARKAIEIGRYKGGSTILIAAAMKGQGELWSIDNGEKEVRLDQDGSRKRPYDDQIRDFCQRHGLHVQLLIGDSRTLEVNTGQVDLVFIDGDHSYEGVKSDFERFGTRVRIGGAVLFDDAFADLSATHSDTVGRLIQEITAERTRTWPGTLAGQYRLVKSVNRLAHLERVT